MPAGLTSATAAPLLILALIVATNVPGAAQATSAEAAIRAARTASNQAIARHDVPGILRTLAEDYSVVISNGALRRGREETAAAFSERFAEFPDLVFERLPESVEVDGAGQVAAELGRWTGRWTAAQGPVRTGGRYAAYWRKVGDNWLIHSELFVPVSPGPGRVARGSFTVRLSALPVYHAEDSTLGRRSIDKVLEGDLIGESRGEMLSVMAPVQGSAGYVALERVTGTLHGRRGSFVLQHYAIMTRGAPEQLITVVPDSGTGELAGLTGRFRIILEHGRHFYAFEYSFAEAP